MDWESSILTTRVIGKTNIKQTLHYKVAIEKYNWRESFGLVFFGQIFFIWGTKKVVAGRIRQVTVLYSDDCMRICLGELSTGRIRQVVAL